MTGHKVPPPPKVCKGFIYTVEPGDTLFLIARRFGVSLDSLIRANPQIKDPALIFPGQKICVPTKDKKEVLEILAVDFLDEEGRPLPVDGGFVILEPVTIIRVTFSIPVASVLFFHFPTGVDTFEFTTLIGAVRNGRVVEFRWEVPPALLAFFFVIGCTNSICRKSEDIGVFLPE